MNDQLTKIEAKILNELHKAHKKKWNKVRKKILKLKVGLVDKHNKLLIADSKECNADLLEVLFVAPQFTSVDDYLDTVDAYLRSENDCYDYSVTLVYVPSKMKELMQVITNHHNQMDRLDSLIERLGE